MPKVSNIPVSDYHSAHALPLVSYEPRREFRIDASIAFVHDLTNGLPQHYQFCDLLYADLPWANGFDEFNRRAGINDGRTYAQFLGAVGAAVESTDRPTFLVTGKHALRSLPKPAHVAELLLNQYPSVAIMYNADPPVKVGTATELLGLLAQQYDSVGDFCCGYGRTLRAFYRQRKPFVGSDFNPHCIGYIAAHAAEWKRAT